MFIFNPMIHVANTKLGIEFEHVNMLKSSTWRSKVFEICQILLFLFCPNKDQFWIQLMLKISSADVWRRKKTVQGNTNCSAPQYSYRGSMVANEINLPYLQLCGKALMRIFMYVGCKSDRKLRQNNKNSDQPKDTNKQIFTKYFVRTDIPRYLGTQQKNNVFTKVTKYGRWKLYSFETEIDA